MSTEQAENVRNVIFLNLFFIHFHLNVSVHVWIADCELGFEKSACLKIKPIIWHDVLLTDNNSLAYWTLRLNAVFTRALQGSLSIAGLTKFLVLRHSFFKIG